jgi:membrane protease YdiL (CAAX protease family)
MHTAQAGPAPELGGADGAAVRRETPPPTAARAQTPWPRLRRRYRVRENGGVRTLFCSEAPTLAVRVERGRSVPEAVARKAEPGSIYLDGAAQGPPFVDPQRSVYNLDHHEGCVRPFTLATCEQAMVLVRRLTDLRRRDWTVWTNDIDLDTVLAIWVLLNHHRLNGDDPGPRQTVMPLLRLEGTIDVHGIGNPELSGLPPETLEAAGHWMSTLQEREKTLRARGRWENLDPFDYLVDRLHAIDSHVYPPGTFDDVQDVEELARVDIGERSAAVACRSRSGIYETEVELRRLHGDRLGVIVLQRARGAYSIRQVDPELPNTLDALYARLNVLDTATAGARSDNRWGGSAEIGGSPRASGTRLSLDEIMEACRVTYHPVSARAALGALVRTACASAAIIGLAAGATLAASTRVELALGGSAGVFAVGMAVLAALVLVAVWRQPGRYGLRQPTGPGAWALAPLALLAALLGGAWVPQLDAPSLAPNLAGAITLAVTVALPAAAELVFRGFVQGRMAWTLLRPGTRGDTAAALLSAALFAPWIALPWLAERPALLPLPAELEPWAPLGGALLLGCTLGLARQRSESVLVPIVLHVTACLAVGAIAFWL